MVESIAIMPRLQVLFGRYDIMLLSLGKKGMGIIMKKMLSLALTVAMILGVTSGCKKKIPKFELEVGDIITMGKYEDEDIEWEVMHRNFVIGEDKVIVELQSTCAIECLPFNEDGESSWEDCTLREWLNNDFFEEAFTKSEKKSIIDTSYSMYTGDARWLTDKVFLPEYLKYRMNPQDATCEPTDHTEDLGIQMENGSCKFWTRDVNLMRSAGGGTSVGSFVFCLGTKRNNSGHGPDGLFSAEDVGVRPVISVECEGTFEMKDIDVADRITFGTYSEEPITWVVFDKDKNGITAVSKYALEKMRMNKKDVVDFADTSLHDWLNEEFYEDAFTDKQKKLIVADEDDDSVTLPEKVTVKDFEREFLYEMLTGYSKSFCEENDVAEGDSLAASWCKGRSKNNKAFLTLDLARGGRAANADQEIGVRPMITIKF